MKTTVVTKIHSRNPKNHGWFFCKLREIRIQNPDFDMRLSVFHSEDPDIPDFSSASENIRILNPDIEHILIVRMYLFLKPKSIM